MAVFVLWPDEVQVGVASVVGFLAAYPGPSEARGLDRELAKSRTR